jgi:hypothetical protein
MSQPVIAFCETDGSIWLAHGVDVVGQSEERGEPTAHSLQLTATAVRGVLWRKAYGTRQTAYGAELLDIAGRRVLELREGANDVSRLSPGVYFVREAAGGERSAASIRKVVVTR